MCVVLRISPEVFSFKLSHVTIARSEEWTTTTTMLFHVLARSGSTGGYRSRVHIMIISHMFELLEVGGDWSPHNSSIIKCLYFPGVFMALGSAKFDGCRLYVGLGFNLVSFVHLGLRLLHE